MTPSQIPSLDDLKQEAKRLRVKLAESGRPTSHGATLEILAAQHGFKDWNTLAASTNGPPAASNDRGDMSARFQLGNRVVGVYLGQSFQGEILGVHGLPDGRYRLTVRFDQPVDVVEFEGMSNFRQRITTVVAADGVSPKKRSDGTPHLRVDG
ncbi:MAG: glyoxalase superfamily protein [Rhizobiaceae bacterium]